MPKLNVKQNNSNVIKAFQVALETGHRNLLDNPWFGVGEVVNQRKVTTFTSGIWNIDRWAYYKSVAADSMALTDSGISSTYSSGYHHISQRLPEALYNYLKGQTATLSVLFSDGTILSGTSVIPDSTSVNFIPQSTGTNGIIQGSNQTVYIRSYNNKTIRAVKLERGPYSTLANDVPPEYDMELDHCKYYFERVAAKGVSLSLGAGYNDGTNTMYGIYRIKPKRQTPNLSGSNLLIGTTSLNTNSTSKSIYSFGDDGDVVIQIVASGAFQTNQMYRFGLPANGYLDFSADL